jgi:hypothetical protein
MTTEPMAEGRGWNGRTFSRNNLACGAHDHFHRHNFFVFGVGGPSVVGPDYAAHDTCWTQFATFYGWQWFYVC